VVKEATIKKETTPKKRWFLIVSNDSIKHPPYEICPGILRSIIKI